MIRRYFVRVRMPPPTGNPHSHGRYSVRELPDGRLAWEYHGRVWNGERTDLLVLPRGGSMTDKEVSGDEAEILTGLHMPAAMDRLRELVHESPSS